MVVVNLSGGVGNQMFQYAFGRYLSLITHKELCLNIDLYKQNISNRNYDLDMFMLSEHRICTNKELNIIDEKGNKIYHYIIERFFHYDLELVNSLESKILTQSNIKNSNLVITGYWQTYKYFEKISDLILKDFTFKNPLFGKWKSLLEEIESSESVMINVRRGDYLNNLGYHGVVSLEYITEAMKIIKAKLKNPKFFLFSDDINWCKEYFHTHQDLTIIDQQYYDSKYQYYLQLMSGCKHFIISNSTFGWWSVFLSKNKDKIVIAPFAWFSDTNINPKDIYMENWIKL